MASGGFARVAQLEYLWGPGERIPVGVGRRDLQITPEATEAYPGFLCVLKEVVAVGKCLSCGIDQIGKRGDFAASAAPWIWLSQTPLLPVCMRFTPTVSPLGSPLQVSLQRSWASALRQSEGADPWVGRS